MTDLKRAPAPAWPHLTRLLRFLEVGESGVLRVEDAALAGLLAEYEWLDNGETWVPVLRDGAELDVAPWVLDQPVSPPLRPGRYWVPERWRVSHSDGGPLIVVGEVADPQPCNLLDWFAVYPERFPLRYGAHSPATLPALAARLACEVGEEDVQAWCEECEGDGQDHYYDYLREQHRERACPTCLGSPRPWWVYENVKRIEVE